MNNHPQPVLDRGFVALIDEPNSDLKVVNAARVSFAKKSTTFEERDAKLISYLAKHNHWTPFAHCRYHYQLVVSEPTFRLLEQIQEEGVRWRARWLGNVLGVSTSLWTAARWGLPIPAGTCDHSYAAIVSCNTRSGFDVGMLRLDRQPLSWDEWREEEPVTLHIKMPVFVARQWMRSNVGIVYNEVSRRYVDDTPDIHVPDKWRKRPDKSIKQGSSDEAVEVPDLESELHSYEAGKEPITLRRKVGDARCLSRATYDHLLRHDVAPEQARIVLPVAHYTEVWMTASLRALARVLRDRLAPNAQWEIRQYAVAARDLVAPKYPLLERLIHETT